MARTFGAGKMQTFIKIIFPSNLHTLLNCLKINIGLSLVGVIAGEFLVSRAGLGYLIVYGGQVFQMDLVMTSVIILAVVAALFYRGIMLLERVVMKKVSHK
jgi:NitT/TauT family transport system permease protein